MGKVRSEELEIQPKVRVQRGGDGAGRRVSTTAGLGQAAGAVSYGRPTLHPSGAGLGSSYFPLESRDAAALRPPLWPRTKVRGLHPMMCRLLVGGGHFEERGFTA